MKKAEPNILIHEASPYLRQHAYNPVNWLPWHANSLQTAREKDLLMVISIGYSACHWCHVMEKESFMDEAVAALMNRSYVSLKVDREERPDVDQVYMQSAYLITGSGGWPLNVIALPDGRPVYAGTYFPKEKWMEVLAYFDELYRSNKALLLDQADRLADGIREQFVVSLPSDNKTIEDSQVGQVAGRILSRIDPEYGGLFGAPKFPLPAVSEFLLHYHHFSGEKKFLDMALNSLQQMAAGGIYDQLGGGFCRYATDKEWKVPHFEKMLYDNGQLLSLYANAHSISPHPVFESVIRETIAFAARELLSPLGGFYAALDADSEGVEGKFYTWTKDEIAAIAGDASDAFTDFYGITEEGNWEKGVNILFRPVGMREPGSQDQETFQKIRQALLHAREERIRPGLDDKILTSWNSLMLSGILDAYRVLGDEQYLQMALRNAHFLSSKMLAEKGKVYRTFQEGKQGIGGFLDDHAFMSSAFIRLYRATFDESWLFKARDITHYVLENFYEAKDHCFYFTAGEDTGLIHRPTDYADNVIPSPVSVMLENLDVLNTFFGDAELEKIRSQTLKAMLPAIRKNPVFHAHWARQLLSSMGQSLEIVIVGPEAEAFRKSLDRNFLPSSKLFGGKKGVTFSLFEYKYIEGKTLIYVCRNRTCHAPCDNVEQALEQIKNS